MRGTTPNLSILTPIIAAIIGLIAAIWLGRTVGYGNTTYVYLFLGGFAAMAAVLGFRHHIWLLVPLCWPLTGRIGFLPVPFSVQEMGAIVAFGVMCVQIAMKQDKGRPAPANFVDGFLWLNVLVIIAMYARHPIGFSFLGSENVGGRPFITVLVGFLAFAVLSRISVQPKLGYYFPAIMLGPNFIVGCISVATYIFPGLVPIIYPIYSGVTISTYMSEEMGVGSGAPVTLQEGRFQGLGYIGLPIVAAIVAYHNPLKAMSPMAPRLFALLAFATICVGLAGFRNMIFTIIMTMIIGAYFWGKGLGLFKILFLGTISLALIISTQAVVELPRSIQRSLSFIPGPWNENVKKGAQESTDWRVDMWTKALTTDRYIKDKIFGDGFGFTREELSRIVSASMGGEGFVDGEGTKESFMILGSFHSGPVSSIRFAGYFGLICLVAFQFCLAFYGYSLLKKSWNTPYRPLAIILAFEAVYRPLHFILIFGDYRTDLPNAFFLCGMLKLLRNSLVDYKAAEKMKNIPRESSTNAKSSESGLKPLPA